MRRRSRGRPHSTSALLRPVQVFKFRVRHSWIMSRLLEQVYLGHVHMRGISRADPPAESAEMTRFLAIVYFPSSVTTTTTGVNITQPLVGKSQHQTIYGLSRQLLV